MATGTKTRSTKARQDKTADTFAKLAEAVVAEMETNPTGWTRPWVNAWRNDGRPTNIATGRPYTGGNAFAFTVAAMVAGYNGPAWGTYKQWQAAGGQVRKGEKGTTGLRVNVKEYDDPDDKDTTGQPVKRRRVFFVGFSVFHADQVEGGREIAEAKFGTGARFDHDPVTEAEALIQASGADIRRAGAAFYSPAGDYVGLPSIDQFPDRDRYYTTALHELVHWTGHQSRTGRHPAVFPAFGSADYAREELVAELGAVFLGAGHLGLDVALREDHAAYLANWIQAIKDDPRAIWTAAGKAEEAATWLINRAGGTPTPDPDPEEDEQ